MTATHQATMAEPSDLLALDPRLQQDFQKRVRHMKQQPQAEQLSPGVIYLGHIPKGLYEPQLKSYFSQFGNVSRVRLSRSKKTGNSKGYAFVEFDCDEVAKIVADTMNNYLFNERLLKCQFVPPEKVHEQLFKGSETLFRKPKNPAVQRYNKKRSPEEQKKMNKRLLEKERRVRKRIAAKGIEYDFPGFAAQITGKRKRKKHTVPATDLSESVNSQDPTPVCTPSVIERRKSLQTGKDDDEEEDKEIILKLPGNEADSLKKAKKATQGQKRIKSKTQNVQAE
ncbi:MKI67 FHA domain-interacting nucleolar phosphoprotein [Microcaecilia unicolor]|uniref:MKI67 FHA domain-interacting nucleolar phosphoprotein n=1 Tax=Microcaecilia unicolor TaxID=1415580 RepID=A0A6P7YM32_9AMPH|nr:MKI67 FHA domain-interacting nucleolar phosphoprotein [Microcaecilia unicolor]